MLAAGGLKIVSALRHGAPAEDWTLVGVAFVVAAVVSFFVVKWLLTYVRSHDRQASKVFTPSSGPPLCSWPVECR